MAGQLALGAEVLLGLDDPRAEELRPVAVDRHAGRQRVVAVDEPLRQGQPVDRSSPGAAGGAPWARRASTTSPGSRKFPLRSTCVTRRFSLGSSTMTGNVGISGLDFSSLAISSRSGFSSGAIDR